MIGPRCMPRRGSKLYWASNGVLLARWRNREFSCASSFCCLRNLRSCIQPQFRAKIIGLAKQFGRSEEHTSELQSLMRISYAVFCLKKKKNITHNYQHTTDQEYRKTTKQFTTYSAQHNRLNDNTHQTTS